MKVVLCSGMLNYEIWNGGVWNKEKDMEIAPLIFCPVIISYHLTVKSPPVQEITE
jgi:hypothetical protein